MSLALKHSLAELVYVARSSIHGRGVFAKRRIEKGTLIGRYAGPPAKRDGKYVLWVPKQRSWVGIRGRNALRYLNHSSKPNAEMAEDEVWAIKTIRPHQEITFDYGDEWADVE